MDEQQLLERIELLEHALSIAIEALEEHVGGDESPTLDYLERVINGVTLDDLGP